MDFKVAPLAWEWYMMNVSFSKCIFEVCGFLLWKVNSRFLPTICSIIKCKIPYIKQREVSLASPRLGLTTSQTGQPGQRSFCFFHQMWEMGHYYVMSKLNLKCTLVYISQASNWKGNFVFSLNVDTSLTKMDLQQSLLIVGWNKVNDEIKFKLILLISQWEA